MLNIISHKQLRGVFAEIKLTVGVYLISGGCLVLEYIYYKSVPHL